MEFRLRNVFNDVMNISQRTSYHSQKEEHFGVSWRANCYHYDDHFIVNFQSFNGNEYRVKAKLNLKIPMKSGKILEKQLVFPKNSNNDMVIWKCRRIKDLPKFIINGNLTIDLNVKILEIEQLGGANENPENFEVMADDVEMEEVLPVMEEEEDITEEVIEPHEKKFVIKHTFTNDMNKRGSTDGKVEKKFGLLWRIYSYWDWNDERLCVNLETLDSSREVADVADDWSILTNLECQISSKYEKIEKFHEFDRQGTTIALASFTDNDVDEMLQNDEFIVEIKVKINEIRGIELRKLRSFDESKQKFSDVVLVIEGEKFYVSKMFLASQSTYFELLFFGSFKEAEESEMELKEIDPHDFQGFLEVIHGESSINDYTIDGILLLADMYDSPTAMRRCEEFLVEKSRKTLTDKFDLAVKHKMDSLMEKCLTKMRKKSDILAIIPEDPDQLDKELYVKLLRKACQL